MFFAFNKRTRRRQNLPAFQQTGLAAPQRAVAPLITNFAEIENLTLTDNPEILSHLQKINGECPGIVTAESEIYCINRNDLSKSEAHSLNRIIAAVRNLTGKEPAIFETTRPVFESYTNKTRELSLQQQAQESSNQVNELLTDAICKKATDIHLEISGNSASVYQRIYGQMTACQNFDKSQGIKIVAAIWNIYVKQAFSSGDVAKDGRFIYDCHGQKWLCRVSYGYSKVTGERSMVIRLRDMKYIPEISSLGYHASQLKLIKEAFMNKGMTLIIGAVNSGKSTTQTALMKTRPALEKNLEISDQIEVELGNFVQLQLPIEGTGELIRENREKLRRISTRHDVDFIAINEIRDFETAAMTASMMLQGAGGIASIHGSGWVDAINRLLSPTDLNVSADILFSESFLNLIIAQSLVGVLCDRCKLERQPDPFWEKYYEEGFGPEAFRKIAFHNPEGCDYCRHSGIQGLTLVAEIIPVTDGNRHLLMNTAQPERMRDWLRDHRIMNIHQHAYGKILSGDIDPLMAQRKIGNFTRENLFDDWHC